MEAGLEEKAKKIRLLILDVDGVLTSGTIYYSGSQDLEYKGFHVHDGLGITLLQKIGIPVAVISAKKSQAVSRRMNDLNIHYVYLGYSEKLPVYEELKLKLQLNDNEIAYVGDDLLDLPLLCRAGLAVTVPQAPDCIREHVDFTTTRKAGEGAVREVCEFIMNAKGVYQSMIQSYLVE
jgi:3-deoxy-D-manno-octulosonate 8-phosphate phosphatase (KDO 8-P phosphatase)